MTVKDALSARIVAHYLGGEEEFPVQARIAVEAMGIRLLPSPDRAGLRKLVLAVPADVLLISSALIPGAARTLSALRRLYGRRSLSVIVLARPQDQPDAVARMLAAGADDVLSAPPDPALLAARIETALRTIEQLSVPDNWPRGVLRTADGEIALDVAAHRCLVRDGGGYREVLLTRKQLAALAALLRAGGRPVRWQDLFRRGWRPGKLRRRSRTLVQHVIALRRKLGAAGRRIVSLPGVGYQITP
jgi:DNA-binding response OmpR family regulator